MRATEKISVRYLVGSVGVGREGGRVRSDGYFPSPSSAFIDGALQRRRVASPSVPIGPETGLTYLLHIESVLVRVELGLAREVAREAESLLSRVRTAARPAYLRINIKDGAPSA